MNRLLIATAAVALATVGTAGAADLPVKAPPLPPAPVYTWTGCYVSGGLGYGMWNQDHHVDVLGVQVTSDETSGGRGWLGRVGGGCDYQVSSSFVIGAFADYDFMNLRSHDFADLGLGLGATLGAQEKESGSWAAGLRLGYLPYPNLMTFVSGGWTQARFDRMDIDFITNPPVALGVFIDAHTYNGAFIGGGYEYRLPFAPSLTWKTEYRFNWYNSADLPILFADGFATGVSEHVEKTVQTVTTSLVWRFDFGGPVVARY
jgi:outer membrane immunogenic protein